MLITKREEVTKQGFCKILWRRLRPRGSLLLEFTHSSGWGGVSAYLSLLGGVGGGRLFEGGRLLTFSAFRMGAYPRWALIRGWALIRINVVMWKAIMSKYNDDVFTSVSLVTEAVVTWRHRFVEDHFPRVASVTNFGSQICLKELFFFRPSKVC